MDSFDQICKDIKDVKIQGAENIAIAAVKAYYERPTADSIHKLISLRPTEPCLRNALKFVSMDIKNVSKALHHFEDAKQKIAQYTSKKISNGMILFTHCHSSTVVNAIKYTHLQGKKLEIHNTETRPLFQGRRTSIELSEAGIEVIQFVDSAARIALKKADLFLLGADAVTSEGEVINKVGSEMFAIIAEKLGVPLYICTDSWKLDPKTIFGYDESIEKRKASEIWPNAPKHVIINNFSFEKINPNLIAGIISELGVFKPEVFVEEVIKAYPWMLQ